MMQTNINFTKKSVVLLTVLLLAFTLGCSATETYNVPFSEENVERIIVSNWWKEYKSIEDDKGIHELYSQFNDIKILSIFDEKRDNISPGTYGYTYLFQLSDGTQYEYSAVSLDSSGARFNDSTGTAYKVRNFNPIKIWNQLDYEIHLVE